MKYGNGKYLLIKEISSQAKVPVGTLLHYNHIGLLNPQLRSSSGYRLYSPQDIEKLDRILCLKNFGFGLSEIKTLLHQDIFNAPSILNSLRTQAEQLHTQILKAQNSYDLLTVAINTYETQKVIDWKQITQLKNNVTGVNSNSWWDDLCLTEGVRAELNVCADKFKKTFHLDKKGYDNLWIGLIAEIRNNLTEDAAGDTGKDLGGKLVAMLQMFYGTNRQLARAVYLASKQQGYMLREGLTQEIKEWSENAVRSHNLYPQ